MKFILLFAILASLLVTAFLTPWTIKFMRKIGLMVQDQHKPGKPLVPVSGGFAVLSGVIAGLMVAIFMQTFFYDAKSDVVLVLAATTSILIITLVGFIDDLLIKSDNSSSIGLRQWQKPLLTLAAAIPLMVIGAGISEVYLPLVGVVNLGLVYSLVIIPLGVIGASNMVNLLGGFNGMEAGLGIIYMGMLGLYAIFHGRQVAAILALVMFAALLVYYFYNKVPAKILPGDSLTYLLGGTLACIAIVGNIERAAIIISIPFIIEFFLKLRGKFKKHTVGILLPNGKIKSKYKKIYSIPHIFTRTGKFTEKEIVYAMLVIQLVFASLIWLI
ncbi:MAG: hypothetical protein ABIF40_03620 [archaeon]